MNKSVFFNDSWYIFIESSNISFNDEIFDNQLLIVSSSFIIEDGWYGWTRRTVIP